LLRTLTVSRGDETSGAKTWQIGDVVDLRITEGIMQQLLQGDANVITDTNADMVDGIHANVTATADQLLALDTNSVLPATSENAELLENNDSAYHLDRANHTGSQTVDAFTGRIGSEMFTADDTFVVPAGVTKLRVFGAGGGGGGGGGEGGSSGFGGYGNAGSGGRSGELYWEDFTVVGGASIGIDIGAGGVGGSFGTYYANNGTAGSAGDHSKITGPIINAGSFIVGKTYTIVTVGTTDYTLIGATASTIGVVFVATGAGTGTGTADLTLSWGGGDGGSGGGAPFNGVLSNSGESQEPYSKISGVAGTSGANQTGGDGGTPSANSFAGSGGGAGGGGGGGGQSNKNGGDGGDGGHGFVHISW